MSDPNYLVAQKIKVITIGDQSVGKSSLLKKFMNDEFEYNYTVSHNSLIPSQQLELTLHPSN